MNSTIKKLKEYDEAYYNNYNMEKSLITDVEYDELREKARKKYPDHEYFKTVGAPIRKKNEKVKLPFVLGSLNKVKTEEDLKKWLKNGQIYSVTEKIDGLSIYVKFDGDKLIQATTRGNGEVGQDITEKAKLFCPTPKDVAGKIEFRGEVVLPGDFYKILGAKNRRNACAGLINQKGTKNCKKLFVKFYEVINAEVMSYHETTSEIDRLKMINDCFGKKHIPKFEFLSTNEINIDTLSELLLKMKKEGNDYQYEIDGLVLAIENSSRENVYYPTNKIAFKVDDAGTKTKAIGCRWQTSRHGKIKPVIKIDPLNLKGVTISNVTGFNYEFIENNNIGIGTELEIIRSGDVIPHITNVTVDFTITHFHPEVCPSCGGEIKMDGVDLTCDNLQCPAQTTKRISHFFKVLDVEYVGEKTVELLVKELNLTCVEDFFNLREYQMKDIKGLGSKKIKNILSEMKKCIIDIKPEKLLQAFGIDTVGETVSKTVLKYYTIDDLFLFGHESTFTNIDGIGEVISDNLIDGLRKFSNLFYFLFDKGLYFKEKIESSDILQDKIFTLTGKGSRMRKEYQTDIENLGGSVKSITKNTIYLVTNDINSKSGKMRKAKSLGIEIITYDILEEMIK